MTDEKSQAPNDRVRVTWSAITKLMREMGPAVLEAIQHHAVQPLSTRIADLELQVAALRAEKSATFADAYRGLWMPGAFKRGDLVTADGSLWLALEDSKGKPGSDSAWRLVVKRGKDAKEAR